MERELFDWDGWDGDMDSMIFYNPVLKIDIGRQPAGTKFASACIGFDNGILQFHDEEGHLIDEYKLCLMVVPSNL